VQTDLHGGPQRKKENYNMALNFCTKDPITEKEKKAIKSRSSPSSFSTNLSTAHPTTAIRSTTED
jgi:hypothetical protein